MFIQRNPLNYMTSSLSDKESIGKKENNGRKK